MRGESSNEKENGRSEARQGGGVRRGKTDRGEIENENGNSTTPRSERRETRTNGEARMASKEKACGKGHLTNSSWHREEVQQKP